LGEAILSRHSFPDITPENSEQLLIPLYLAPWPIK